MRNNIIVYGATKERAYEKLQSILDDMRYGDVKRVIKGEHDFRVELKNGDHYRAVGAIHSARGYKWQYAFIDRLVSREMLNDIILPSFIPLREGGGSIDDWCVEIKDRYKWF